MTQNWAATSKIPIVTMQEASVGHNMAGGSGRKVNCASYSVPRGAWWYLVTFGPPTVRSDWRMGFALTAAVAPNGVEVEERKEMNLEGAESVPCPQPLRMIPAVTCTTPPGCFSFLNCDRM